MRKTLTLSSFILDTADRARTEKAVQQAIERRLGEPAAHSEASRLRQLAEVGARVVSEEALGQGYAELRELLGLDPSPLKIQTQDGLRAQTEDDTSLTALFEAIGGPE
ncbi:MAG TPA: hypothetical protein ENH00_12790 [Actinobacteria bacterium]|nr:hypothetical protein [Actinomycetota bacterium]HDL50351.1 hypothetical protein [Actinomycetota bacterium]